MKENKKVELKITISGKVNNNNKTEMNGNSTDKASTFSHKGHSNIKLLSNLFTKNTNKENAKTVQSISDDISTAQSSPTVEHYSKELELKKYSEITSSLNSIISTAKNLDELTRNSFTQMKIGENSGEMNSSKSKIPVSTKKSVHTQEGHQSNFSSPTDVPEIKFEVGNPVRPLRITQGSNNFTPIIVSSPDSMEEIFHSPKSDGSSMMSEKLNLSTRRKIAYIPQMTIYTHEEQELLRSNIIANNSDSFDIPSMPLDSSIFPRFDDYSVRGVGEGLSLGGLN